MTAQKDIDNFNRWLAWANKMLVYYGKRVDHEHGKKLLKSDRPMDNTVSSMRGAGPT